MNFSKLTQSIKDNQYSTAERDSFVEFMVAQSPKSAGQVFAMLCKAFEEQGITPAPAKTDWDVLSQGQRDLLTVYSQTCRKLGLEMYTPAK